MTFHFIVDHVEGKGQDALAVGDRYAVVCDGLGGRGAMICRNKRDNREWAEAQIASYVASQTVGDLAGERMDSWTEKITGASEEAKDAEAARIAQTIRDAIAQNLAKAAGEWESMSSMAQTAFKLPTTLAAVLAFPADESSADALVIWAGDSRCYLIDEEQLCQLSRDDVNEDIPLDAMNDLLAAGSAEMKNRIGLDMDFTLNHKLIRVTNMAMLFCASDGIYGYLKSPMHLEYIVRHCASFKKREAMEQKFVEFYRTFDNDDASFAAVFVNGGKDAVFEDYTAMLSKNIPRLKRDYIDTFPRQAKEETVEDTTRFPYDLSQSLEKNPNFADGVESYLTALATQNGSPAGEFSFSSLVRELRASYEDGKSLLSKRQLAKKSMSDHEEELRGIIGNIRIPAEFYNAPQPAFSFYNKSDMDECYAEINRILEYYSYFFVPSDHRYKKPDNQYFADDMKSMEQSLNRVFSSLQKQFGGMYPGVGIPTVQHEQRVRQTQSRSLTTEESENLFRKMTAPAVIDDQGLLRTLALTWHDFHGLYHARTHYIEAKREYEALAAAPVVSAQDVKNKVHTFVRENASKLSREYARLCIDDGKAPYPVDSPEIQVEIDRTTKRYQQAAAQKAKLEKAFEAYQESVYKLWEQYKPRYEKYLH